MITLSVIAYLIIALIIAITYQKDNYINRPSFLKRLRTGLLCPAILVLVSFLLVMLCKLFFILFTWLLYTIFWIGTNMP
jgi:hypothetical protein